jgi:hypothetical protein
MVKRLAKRRPFNRILPPSKVDGGGTGGGTKSAWRGSVGSCRRAAVDISGFVMDKLVGVPIQGLTWQRPPEDHFLDLFGHFKVHIGYGPLAVCL